MYKDLLYQIQQGKTLRAEEMEQFFQLCEQQQLSPVQQAALLSALQTKGVNGSELSHAVRSLLRRMPERFDAPEAIDICGTGGSGLPRINTSTITAFILSALGVEVAKHGNRAASGRFGSVDLLEALGVNIDLSAAELQQLSASTKLSFLYARSFHPTMKHFAKVRKEIASPTIFNLLGPLLSPVQVKRQIIGTAFSDQMTTIAEAAKKLRRQRVLVVSGEDGLDEVTLTGKTRVVELKQGQIRKRTLTPASFGLRPCSFEEIKGGSAKRNTQIALSILQGTCESRHLDLVLVNAALALQLAGKTRSLKKAYQMAKDCVQSGQAYQQYLNYKRCSHAPSILLDIAAHKREEVKQRKRRLPLSRMKKKLSPSQRDFRRALLRGGLSLIAEIKKASPSAGRISEKRFDVSSLAKQYEKAGARALSVVTDQKYFQGSLDALDKAAFATSSTPLLCKDFILDEYQVYEARRHGADAILLIARLLSAQQLQDLINCARSLHMDALVEIHDEADLERALETDAEIIGINSRDLHSFRIDPRLVQRLSKKIRGKIVVAESGIKRKADLKKLPHTIDAVLIGTSLVKSPDPLAKIHALFGKPQPLLKICGVQSTREAQACQKAGVDMVGLNFVPTSKRRISYQTAQRIVESLRKRKRNPVNIVGVFQDQPLDEVNTVVEKIGLDSVQLSGKETISYIKKVKAPVIKGISVLRERDVKRAEKYLPYVSHILFDGTSPGSGQSFRHGLAKGFSHPFLLAGGIDPDNVQAFIQLMSPLGVDVASGVESNEKRDLKKIQALAQHLSSAS